MKPARIRFHRITNRLLIGVVCLLMLPPAHAMVRTWTGGADGESWFLAGNWSPDSDVPQPGESVVITNGTLLLDSDTGWLNSLTISNATLMFTKRLLIPDFTTWTVTNLAVTRGLLGIEVPNRFG